MLDYVPFDLAQGFYWELLEEARAINRHTVRHMEDLGKRFPTDLPADMLRQLADGSPQPAGRGWQEAALRTVEQVPAAVRGVEAAMMAEGYPQSDRFAVRLAVEEALVNAIKHGNHGDPAKSARLCCAHHIALVVAEVEDEGEGFDPAEVPDPRNPERLERPGGRGLLLMRHYLDGVRYHGRGNRVTLHKRRSPA